MSLQLLPILLLLKVCENILTWNLTNSFKVNIFGGSQTAITFISDDEDSKINVQCVIKEFSKVTNHIFMLN